MTTALAKESNCVPQHVARDSVSATRQLPRAMAGQSCVRCVSTSYSWHSTGCVPCAGLVLALIRKERRKS